MLNNRSRSELVTEYFVFSQMAQDMLNEFRNLPAVHGRFRYETAMAADYLSRMRKRIRHSVGVDNLDYWESVVIDIVDGSEQYVKQVRKELFNEMLQKVSYDMIEPAVQIGMIGGFIDVAMQIRKALTGKSDDSLNECLRYLRYIDKHIGFRALNEGVEPNYEKCKDSMIKMYQQIGALVRASVA